MSKLIRVQGYITQDTYNLIQAEVKRNKDLGLSVSDIIKDALVARYTKRGEGWRADVAKLMNSLPDKL